LYSGYLESVIDSVRLVEAFIRRVNKITPKIQKLKNSYSRLKKYTHHHIMISEIQFGCLE
jgi:hypothetical protein